LSQIFIELYSYRPAWIALDQIERERFSGGVQAALAELGSKGVEVIGWGFNDLEADRRAPYDFFCIYRVPSFEFQRAFDDAITASGWHDFFEQHSVSGALAGPAEILAANVALRRPEPHV
jgi:haloalkane dehalogenase